MTRDKPQDRDRSAAGPAASVLPQGSLGAWLRTQREARGVSLREIADASKISLRYLEALEHDRFEVLPAPVFTRGFLREYSRVVGLDPDEVVNLYLLAADERPELPSEELRPRPRASGGPSPLGYGLLLLLGVGVLVGVAALVWWWAQGRSGAAPEPVPPAVGAPVAAPVAAPGDVPEAPAEVPSGEGTAGGVVAPQAFASAPPALPVEPPVQSATATAAAPPAAPPAASPAPLAAAPRADAGLAAAPGPAPAAAPMRVVLEFSEDCWVEYVLDGGRRTSELRTSGEVVQIEAASSILLTVGNVPAVRVEVDGRPFALPAGARVVRDLRIGRDTPAGGAGTEPAP